MSSKTKTFHIETEVYELHKWLDDQIEAHERSVVYGGSEPSEEYVVETNHKYIITVTKVETLIN